MKEMRISVLSCVLGLVIPFGGVCAQELGAARLLRELRSVAPAISTKVLSLALRASDCASSRLDEPQRYLAVIDYSLPSTKKRFWLLDLSSKKLLREELVAHGKNSGDDRSTRFSNELGSLQSSLGLFAAADTYMGQHGYSLRLRGLDPGFNDRALDRNIVVHGADYVSEKFVKRWNRLGRSWGCPALPLDSVDGIIDVLKEGAYVFAYYPDREWLSKSALLNRCNLGSASPST